MGTDAEPIPLPPGQQRVAPGKWPVVGEQHPRWADGDWSVNCSGAVLRSHEWRLEELRLMPQETHRIDIHCVTRWSKPQVEFRGVPLHRLITIAQPSVEARFVSFVAASEREHSTSLPLDYVQAENVLVAFEADGAPLSTAHGGPVRIVVPGRYFYKSLKWLERIELLVNDRLGYWEQSAGYHNGADPWQEERFIASNIDQRTMRELAATRDFSGRDLRGMMAAGLDLAGLQATGAQLRDAHFERAILSGSCFAGANLSGAHLQQSDLRGTVFEPSHCGKLADLEGADFRGADLRGARFVRTSLFGATFGEVDQIEGGLPPAIVDSTTHIDQATLDSLRAIPQQIEFLQAATICAVSGH